MNPYKKSALAAMPEVARLVNRYKNASDDETKGSQEKEENSKQRLERYKRAQPPPPVSAACTCNTANNKTSYNPALSNSTFVYFSAMSVDWNCGFSCCISTAPAGTWGRLAHISGDALYQDLMSKGVMPNSTTAGYWIGMYSVPNSGTFYWYDCPGVATGSSVTPSEFCNNCRIYSSATWTSGGVKAAFENSQLFYGFTTYPTPTAPICECKYFCASNDKFSGRFFQTSQTR